MSGIDKVLKYQKKLEEETGKHYSYGKIVAAKPDLLKDEKVTVKKPADYHRRLSKEELAKIEADYTAGVTPNKIAEELNISCTAVIQNLKRLGVYKTKSKIWTQEKDKLLTELYINGAPHEEMAQRLGYSKSSIYSRINKLVLAKRKRKELKQ